MESATVDQPATKAATGSATLADLFPAAVRKHGPSDAVLYKDGDRQWISKTYTEVGEIVAQALARADRPRDREGRQGRDPLQHPPEWTLLRLRGAVGRAHRGADLPDQLPEECQYVLENSDAVVVVVEDDEQLDKIREIRDRARGSST